MARTAILLQLRHPDSRLCLILQAHTDTQAGLQILLLPLAQSTQKQGVWPWKERGATTYYRI